MKRGLIVSICVVGLSIVTVWLLQVRGVTEHRIVVSDNGYTPATVQISIGDRVTFDNTSSQEIWPASNAHPSHTAYPAFDPKQPVPPGETWSFTFTKSGVWKFHDHLNPTRTGVITVVDETEQAILDTCSDTSSAQCYEETIVKTLDREGVAAAFAQLVVISDQPGVDCHSYAHLIGEHAYDLFVTGNNFELTPATALCGYGFYHGFMETLLHTSGDINEARNFCEYADQQLRGQVSAAATACYHGIGHGAVDGGDPRDWGDVDAMMAPGFALCEQFAQTDTESYLCTTGVYNAVEVLSLDPKYKLTEIADDPLAVCSRQPISQLEGCYSNMIPAVFRIVGNDVVKANAYYNERMVSPEAPTIEGYTTNDLLTIGLFHEYVRLRGVGTDAMQEGVEICRSQPDSDHLPCIAGIAGGYTKYGTPSQNFYEALDFCRYDSLTSTERSTCYDYVLPRAGSSITESELTEVCNGVPAQYRTNNCSSL